jgi:hypothetical protein
MVRANTIRRTVPEAFCAEVIHGIREVNLERIPGKIRNSVKYNAL